MRIGFSKWTWGIFLLLAAVLVVANQLGGFVEIGFWSIAITALAAAMLISSITSLSFEVIPIPIAVLYYVYQEPLNERFGLPDDFRMGFWTLALVTVLACAGIATLTPHNWKRNKKQGRKKKYNVYVESDGSKTYTQKSGGDNDNNPVIDVSFGGVNRYIHANALETVVINCKFGGAEVYLDNATLSPNGAEVICHLQGGAIELYVPRAWKIIDNLNCTLGGVEIGGRHADPDENAPQLTITGNVSLGGVEINRV
jgi:hypothetical protein